MENPEGLEIEYEAPQDYCDQCGAENVPLSLIEIGGVELWLCVSCFESED